MRKNRDHRVLLVERLESRAMLAGGGVEFQHVHEGSESRPDHKRFDHKRFDRGEIASAKPSRTEKTTPTPNGFLSSQQSFIPQLTPSQVDQVFDSRVTLALNTPSEPSATESPSVPFPRSGPALFPATDFLSSSHSVTDNWTEVNALEGRLSLDTNETSVKPEAEHDGIDAWARTVDRDEQVSLESDNDESSERQVQSDGFMQWGPLTQELSSTPNQQGTLPAWKLSENKIATLTNRSRTSAIGNADVVDPSVVDWLSDDGGMIVLDRVGLPKSPIQINPAWIDVQVESAVTMHRSIATIAEEVAPAMTQKILDGLMASLAAGAPPKPTPLSNQQPGVSSNWETRWITYPALTVAAVGMAILARRRNRQPSFETTAASSP